MLNKQTELCIGWRDYTELFPIDGRTKLMGMCQSCVGIDSIVTGFEATEEDMEVCERVQVRLDDVVQWVCAGFEW